MKQISDLKEWRELSHSSLSGRRTIGFVPTMGALHDGHLSLVRRCVEGNDITVVTIFINPTQFNDPDDLNAYPSDLETDCRLLEEMSVDYLLTPVYHDLYPDDYRYKIFENQFSAEMEGSQRQGHFDGVLTVVMKLLNLVDADRAYFGEKDHQQYLLVRDMALAFFCRTEIILCPTIRERDGLACSSRNALLAQSEREIAPLFYRYLRDHLAAEEIRRRLTESGFEVDYVEEVNGRRYGAVRLGNVRLIDNLSIQKGAARDLVS